MRLSYGKYVNKKLGLFFVAGILLLEALLFSVFGIYGKVMTEYRQKMLVESSMESMIANVSSSKRNIEGKFKQVEGLAFALQDSFGPLFDKSVPQPWNAESYRIVNKAVLNKKTVTDSSGVFYPGVESFTDPKFEKVLQTEGMDPYLKLVVETNENVFQAYFNSFDTLNRVYPYSGHVEQYVGTDIDVTKYQFYYLANSLYNSERGPVWTDVYLDPLGNGWVMSCISPVYTGERLQGVLGLDMYLEEMLEDSMMMSLKMPYVAVLLDQNGEIMAFADPENRVFQEGMQRNEYGRVMRDQRIDAYFDEAHYDEILSMDGLQEAIYDADQDLLIADEFDVQDNQEILVSTRINQGKWTMILAINEQDIFASLNDFNREAADYRKRIYGLAFLGTVVILIAYWLVSQRMAKKIAEPLQHLAGEVSQFGLDSNRRSALERTEIDEIDSLIESFEHRAKAFQENVQELILTETEKNKQQLRLKMLEEISFIDPLTGLYNRRKIDELLQFEIKRTTRYGNTFTVMILDLDNFKEMNDAFGKAVGDELLKIFTERALDAMRETDILGRWGGDEFVFLCPNTGAEDARILATKIRNMVGEIVHDEIVLSCSIGIAQYEEHLDKQLLINRADQALYQAKCKGKNKVVIYQD